ncbi:MAG: hypothetical protein H6719_12875 [Sandaracinaceae bacterium]|nr:hypothetical protein [Sandaracinaceae bacterium]
MRLNRWLGLVMFVFATGCPAGSPAPDAGLRSDAGDVPVDGGRADAGGTDGGGTDAGVEATCTDELQNGLETDVDCGGNTCMPCADGLMCESGPDCASGVCTSGVCVAPSCTDGARNQDESDIDCGGAICDACEDGRECAAGTDCTSGVCDAPTSTCVSAGCGDGVLNGDESDVDCGGSCAPCADGRDCAAGTDCMSAYCSPSMTCATPTCMDGARNQDESDIDCGGTICAGCAVGDSCATGADCASFVCDPATMLCRSASCSDGVINAGETGVDCGGGTCPACGTGAGCASGSDCVSGVCSAMTCAVASCTDAVQNGAETGVDCGGGCPGCATGAACTMGTDCASGICSMATMTCSAPTCTDGRRNGAETGVDCGGGTCAACTAGGGCASGSDCVSGVCNPTTMTCSTAGCMDGVRNGTETAVDCGGTCPGCADGVACGVDGDCASGVCDPTTMTCAMASCTDMARNGIETDVDCGGGVCPSCRDGQGCGIGSDCGSGVCGSGSMTCSAATCTDGVHNGAESDIDCGGTFCPHCPDGGRCLRASDCISGVCDTSTRRCSSPTCSDGVQNGGEGGVDCGGPCTSCIVMASTMFPAVGDTRVASAGLYFWRLGDYVEGSRTLPLTSATRVTFNLQINPNVLSCDTQDVRLSINGRIVGSFSISSGQTSTSQSFTFPAVAGPTFTIRLETTRQVNGGCGSAGYTDGVSTLTLFQ